MLNGSNWLNNAPIVSIKLDNQVYSNSKVAAEAGTGYFTEKISSKNVKPSLGHIEVSIQPNKNNDTTSISASWGSLYWQYFEDLDKITPAATPVSLQKKIYIETISATGPILTEVKDGAALKVGDKIKVRIIVKSDRNLEYVHLKDMRAACLEPINVISQYAYQNGIGYYESTKDVATHYFINWLPKGTFVFEYTLMVQHEGNFSNGISSIECMYAPEFTSHSEGLRVQSGN